MILLCLNGEKCENNELERQRHNKQVNYTQDSSFFSKEKRRAALGGIRTHDTLQSIGKYMHTTSSYIFRARCDWSIQVEQGTK